MKPLFTDEDVALLLNNPENDGHRYSDDYADFLMDNYTGCSRAEMVGQLLELMGRGVMFHEFLLSIGK